MRIKFFVYCKNCGNYDKEVKSKSDMIYNCPSCNSNLKGVKIPTKRYQLNESKIKHTGISMWVSIEKMLEKREKWI